MIILKLLQVIREDEEQRKTVVGQQMAVTCSCHSNSSDYKDCGVTWLLLALESIYREKEELKALKTQ